jgi:hypothetical protein
MSQKVSRSRKLLFRTHRVFAAFFHPSTSYLCAQKISMSKLTKFCSLSFRRGLGRGFISCKRRSTNLPPTDHTHHFREWLGRALTRHEREVINILERSRRRTTIKVHIIDKPGTNSKPILIEYLRYLQKLYPYHTGAILDKTKKSAQAISRTLPRRTHVSSVNRPNYLRGANYDICLIFDPPPEKIHDLIRTTNPAICDNRPGCALIILSTPPQAPPGKRQRRKKYHPPELPDFYSQQLTDHHYHPGPPLHYIAVVELSPDIGKLPSLQGRAGVRLPGVRLQVRL